MMHPTPAQAARADRRGFVLALELGALIAIATVASSAFCQ